MTQNENNQALLGGDNIHAHLEYQINQLKAMLSNGLSLPENLININFPSLNNFYFVNNVYKSSWAIYLSNNKTPKLLYTGNFLIQGGQYGNRSNRSPFGAQALSPLISIANTFSYNASVFKQNWTLDLAFLDDRDEKLLFSLKEYKEFLKLLNNIRAQWLLYLSEEGHIDFVISEFSEPSDPLFFTDLESFDSQATKIKTYFKPISQKALSLLQKLSLNTEFEGKFFSLQPGVWLRDDVLIELEKFYSDKFFDKHSSSIQTQTESSEYTFNNPFKTQALNVS